MKINNKLLSTQLLGKLKTIYTSLCISPWTSQIVFYNFVVLKTKNGDNF